MTYRPSLTTGILAALSLIGTLALSDAATITVTKLLKGNEERNYTVKGVIENQVCLPIAGPPGKDYLLQANWWGDQDAEPNAVAISLQDPSIILPAGGSVSSAPLTIFSVNLALVKGERQLVYETPDYSLWFRLELDSTPAPAKPVTAAPTAPAATKDFVISFVAGKPTVAGETLSEEELESTLRQKAAENGQYRVILRSDENTPYTAVTDVLEVCKTIGLKNAVYVTPQE